MSREFVLCVLDPPGQERRLTHRQVAASAGPITSIDGGGLLKKHNPGSYSSTSRGEQMLQHKWTIHQGNVACLSVWPGQWTGCSRATHSVFLPFSWAVCVFQWHCLCVCLHVCVIDYAGLRVPAAAVILVRSLLLHCWGPSRWSHTDLWVQEKLAPHYNQMTYLHF